jgi:hypothetical protein
MICRAAKIVQGRRSNPLAPAADRGGTGPIRKRIGEGAGTPMPSPGLFARKVKKPLTRLRLFNPPRQQAAGNGSLSFVGDSLYVNYLGGAAAGRRRA